MCKRWQVECEIERQRRGLQGKVTYVATVHDEIQFEVDEDTAEEWAEIAVECVARSGDYFNIRVPLTGEAKIGDNWCQTH